MSSPAEEESAFKPFTKAERIQQLNDIDKSITQLLQSAGLAIQTLTNAQNATENTTTESRRDAFKNASNAYLTTLQSVDVRLKRQINGLEEAGIIPAEVKKAPAKADATQSFSTNSQRSQQSEAKTAGENAPQLDIGWLNSRSGRVGRDMEAELWAKARGFLEDLEARKGATAHGGSQSQDEDQLMTG